MDMIETLRKFPLVALTAACIAVPAFAGGDPDLEGSPELPAVSAGPSASAVAAPAPVSAGPCEGDGQVAIVVSVSGEAWAQSPGEDPRALACDDALRACDVVTTSPGARVGLMAGDVLAHLDTNSRARVDASAADGTPRLHLHSGGLRVVDPRADGATPVHVGTPFAAFSASNGDAELRVSNQARICSHDGSHDVSAGLLSTILDPGGCAVSDGASLRSEVGGEPEIAMEDALSCPFTVAGVVHATDVSADLAGFPGVGPADRFGRGPCDDPGSSCGRNPVGPTPPGTNPRQLRKIFQQNPGTGCGFFPGCTNP